MKILVLFCDMLRANLLRTFNSNIEKEGVMDQWFRQLGGTAYTNCYTPAPDTPRSLACFYTGLYPKHNGCRTRLQWPKYYLMEGIKTLFDMFLENNYHLVIRENELRERVGQFPQNITDENPSVDIFNDLSGFTKALKHRAQTTDNLFAFASLTDCHMAIDDYGHNSWGNHFGQQHLANAWGMIFSEFQPDDFDYVLVFSDHGCKLQEELGQEKPLLLLNDDRSKIVMFLRKKGDKQLQCCRDITSIMDVFPMFRDILNITEPSYVDGCSLLSPKADRFIVIEDYKDFSPEIGAIHALWSVRTAQHSYIRSFSDKVLVNTLNDGRYDVVEDPNPALLKELEEKIAVFSCSYTDNKKQYEILEYYQNLKADKTLYSDGQRRSLRGESILFRLMERLGLKK